MQRPFPLAPRAPLFALALLVATPLLALAALPGRGGPAALVLPALLALACLDAAAGRRRLALLGAELPGVTRLTLDRPGAIEIFVRNPAGRAGALRLGLALPGEFECADGALAGALPAGATRARFPFPVTPRRRGRTALDAVYLEIPSPLGLWDLRAAVRAPGELRVYPSLDHERRRFPALFLPRSGAGVRRRRQAGKGREFEKLRDWSAGDDLADIHWKASAKRGHPVTKLYQVERTQEVYVVIDASRLSARRPPADHRVDAARAAARREAGEASVLERYVSAALVLALAAQRQGDHFGLLTFSDRVHSFIRARSGKSHFQALRGGLYELQPRRVSPDYDEACAFLRGRLRRRALVIFLSDVDDPVHAEQLSRNLELLTRQHLVLLNMLNPEGARPLFSAPAASTGALYEHFAGHLLWRRLSELQGELRRKGVSLAFLGNEKLAPLLVGQYLSVKGRQAL